MFKKREELHTLWCNKVINSSEKKVILNLTQRSGKTYLTFKILKDLGVLMGDILISYPDNKIKEEWENMFRYYNFNYDHITFTNTSSLKKCVDTSYDIAILDEINQLSDKELEYCTKICKRSDRVLGLSGTISTMTETILKDVLDLPILIKYSVEDAIRDNLVSDYSITVYTTPLDNTITTKDSKGKLLTEKKKFDNYTFVIEGLKRNKRDFMFMALARNRILQGSIAKKAVLLQLINEMSDKRVLIFCGLIKMAESLGIPAYHSKTKDPDIFQNFKDGKHNHQAVVGIGKSGATYHNLDSVIMSNMTYNSENTEQTLSRAMMLDYSGKTADIIIVSSNEPVELKKIKETLSGLDQSKIFYKPINQ